MQGVYSTLSNRQGVVLSEEQIIGTLTLIKAFLPVAQSFGFADKLR